MQECQIQISTSSSIPLSPKIQARWSGIYINRLRRMCKAAQENCFPAYSLQITDTMGSRSFLIMIKRHTSFVGSLNIKQGENTDFAITCRVYCMAHTMGCKKLPGMTGSLVLYKGICRKVFSSIEPMKAATSVDFLSLLHPIEGRPKFEPVLLALVRLLLLLLFSENC